MEVFIAIIGLVFVAAITPGPNNLVVLHTAARHGVLATLPSIAGVVAGGLLMLLICVFGPGRWIVSSPLVGRCITVAGSAYLLYLAYQLIRSGPRSSPAVTGHTERLLPAGALGVFGFQFLNPKTWVLVLTATSAFQLAPTRSVSLQGLLLVFAIVPTACLLLWSLPGAAASRWLRDPAAARAVDRVLGLSLAASVVLLWS